MGEPRRNALGQPIGPPVPGWAPRPRPPRTPMVGRTCRVEPLDVARHGAALYRANAEDTAGEMWTYLSVGPFESEARYLEWLAQAQAGDDPLFYAIVDGASGRPWGWPRTCASTPRTGDQGRAPAVRPPPAADAGSDGGDVPDDAPGLPGWATGATSGRRTASTPAPGRRRALRIPFRGHLRQAVVYKGAAGHGLVLHPGRRVAGRTGGLRALARPGQLRCAGRQRRRLSDCALTPRAAPGPPAHSPAGGAKIDPVPLIFSCDTEDYETPAAVRQLSARCLPGMGGLLLCGRRGGAGPARPGPAGRPDGPRRARDRLPLGHALGPPHAGRVPGAPLLGGGGDALLAEEGAGVATCAICWGRGPAPGASRGTAGGRVPRRTGPLGMPVFCDAPSSGPPAAPALRRGPAAALPRLLRPLLGRPACGALRADAGGHGGPAGPTQEEAAGRRGKQSPSPG